MDDLISRQQAIDALTEYRNGRALFISVGEAVIRIEQLPSAQPEPSQVARDISRIIENEKDMRILPKTGHWIIYTVSPFDGEDVKCSECGQRGCAPYWDYCPNCGARMEGVHEVD